MRRVGGQSVVGPAVSPHAYQQYIQAENAYERGEFREALQGFIETQSHTPEDPYLVSRIASTQSALGRMDDAANTLEGALQRYPRSEALWSERARLCRAQGRLEDALASARRAVEYAPLSARAALLVDSLLGDNHAEGLRRLTDFLQRSEGSHLWIWRRIFARAVAARNRHWASQAATTLWQDFAGATRNAGLRPSEPLTTAEEDWLCTASNDEEQYPPQSVPCP